MSNKPEIKEALHDFKIILDGIDDFDDAMSDALYEAGCDDGSPVRQGGRVFLHFGRRAPTLREAVLSAIRDIRRANIELTGMRVEYLGMLTQAEIARRYGASRQAIHRYISGERGPGGFPSPVSSPGNEPVLWSWPEVAEWFHRAGLMSEDASREAREVEAINAVLAFDRYWRAERDLTEQAGAVIGVPCFGAKPAVAVKERLHASKAAKKRLA